MIIEMYTRLQWLERGRIVKGGAVGQWRWPCRQAQAASERGKVQYFEIGETYLHPERAARKLAARKRAKYERAKHIRDRWKNSRTAGEWLESGRVPNDDAIWRSTPSGGGTRHYFLPIDTDERCHIDDTTMDPDRAQKILAQYAENLAREAEGDDE